MTHELIERARSYLAHNAAESGADVLIAELVDALTRSSERTVECSCDNCDADSGPIKFWREQAQRNDWQPIETAPKDGQAFLVWVPSNRCVYAVAAGPLGGLRIFGGDFRDHLQRATHWRPMPTSPSAEDGNG